MRNYLTQLLESFAQLFDVKSIEAMVLRVFGAALILLAGFWISKMLQRFLIHRIHKHDSEAESAIQMYRMIIRVVFFITAGSLALHTLGIDLTHVFTTSGLLAIAAAFAMKTAAENFISGLIIRLEKEFKPGERARRVRRLDVQGQENRSASNHR
jgi:small-conductance mechanosensitive channel